MARPDFPCPQCGRSVPGTMIAEFCLIPPSLERIISVARNFKATCETHGDFITQRFGHHMSTTATQILERLSNIEVSKAEWEAIKRRLSPEERKRLTDALRGFYFPQEEELSRWESLLRNEKAS